MSVTPLERSFTASGVSDMYSRHTLFAVRADVLAGSARGRCVAAWARWQYCFGVRNLNTFRSRQKTDASIFQRTHIQKVLERSIVCYD